MIEAENPSLETDVFFYVANQDERLSAGSQFWLIILCSKYASVYHMSIFSENL